MGKFKYSLALIIIISSCTFFKEEDVPDRLSVSASELSYSKTGESHQVKVSSGTKWDVTSSPEWVSLQSISSGHSPYEWTVIFSASANDDYNREGKIMIRAGSDTAEISVTQDGKKGKYVAVESVSLSPTELTLTEGENASLSYTFSPSNVSVKDVTWETSNSSIATVSQYGRVVANAKGTALITITTTDGNKTASCVVTVKEKVIPVSSVSLSKTSLLMVKDETEALTATVLPINATDQSVIWFSNNSSVATVSSSGIVTAKKAGLASITAQAGGIMVSCSVSVQEIPEGAVNLGTIAYKDDGTAYYVFWAEKNLGATKPEGFGDYYAWGETEEKTSYWYDTYKYSTAVGDKVELYTKYCPKDKRGYWAGFWAGTDEPDGKTELEAIDDVAHVKLGGKWRIPTKSEWNALYQQCMWTFITKNGVNGYEVKSRKKGDTNSIFLPLAGLREEHDLHFANERGSYWSSSLYLDFPYVALNFAFDINTIHCWNYPSMGNRYLGLPVRPIAE